MKPSASKKNRPPSSRVPSWAKGSPFLKTSRNIMAWRRQMRRWKRRCGNWGRGEDRVRRFDSATVRWLKTRKLSNRRTIELSNQNYARSCHKRCLRKKTGRTRREASKYCCVGRRPLLFHQNGSVCRQISRPFFQHGGGRAGYDGNSGRIGRLRQNCFRIHLCDFCRRPGLGAVPSVDCLSSFEC